MTYIQCTAMKILTLNLAPAPTHTHTHARTRTHTHTQSLMARLYFTDMTSEFTIKCLCLNITNKIHTVQLKTCQNLCPSPQKRERQDTNRGNGLMPRRVGTYMYVDTLCTFMQSLTFPSVCLVCDSSHYYSHVVKLKRDYDPTVCDSSILV
jgi:hypothetical protein